MHGRTRVQMYDGKPTGKLGEVKKNLTRTPLIENGDRSPEDAKRMIDIAGVDGVMIGRSLSEPLG